VLTESDLGPVVPDPDCGPGLSVVRGSGLAAKQSGHARLTLLT
jgi:hypothetical protein